MKQYIPRKQKTLIAYCDKLHIPNPGDKWRQLVCNEVCKYYKFCEYLEGHAWQLLPKDVYNKYVIKALIEIGEYNDEKDNAKAAVYSKKS